MAIDIKQQTKTFLQEVYGKGKLELIDELMDEKYEGTDPLLGKMNREGFKRQVTAYRNAFPDLKLELIDIVVEGNKGAYCWKATGTHKGPLGDVQPTGKNATVIGMTWVEYEQGKVVRDQIQWDALGLFRQLGVQGMAQAPIPAETAPGAEARH